MNRLANQVLWGLFLTITNAYERWFYLVCDNRFCFILLLYLGLSSYVTYMYSQTVDIFTCLLMQVITDIY